MRPKPRARPSETLNWRKKRRQGERHINRDPVPAAELLRLYTTAESDAEAAVLLERIFNESIRPCCADSARRAMHSYGVRQLDRIDQLEEIEADVLLHMTVRLKAMRRNPDLRIENLPSYIAVTAANVCLSRLRARSPLHVRLQNRVRYLLRNDARFRLWTNTAGEQIAGFVKWDGRNDTKAAPELQRSADRLDVTVEIALELAGGPLALGDLIGAVANAYGIAPRIDVPAHADLDLACGMPAADATLIQRESLRKLWAEVLLLPTAQRTAVLLNLRDSAGHGVIELLPATAVASFAELAAALSFTEQQFALLWNDLPIDDLRIGQILNVTRQQVINLRKSGRERLARRMKEGNKPAGSASIRERIGSLWRRRQDQS